MSFAFTRPQRAYQRVTVFARHEQIREHDIRPMLRDCFQCRSGRGDCAYRCSARLKQESGDIAHITVVVDDENVHISHVWSFVRLSSVGRRGYMLA